MLNNSICCRRRCCCCCCQLINISSWSTLIQFGRLHTGTSLFVFINILYY